MFDGAAVNGTQCATPPAQRSRSTAQRLTAQRVRRTPLRGRRSDPHVRRRGVRSTARRSTVRRSTARSVRRRRQLVGSSARWAAVRDVTSLHCRRDVPRDMVQRTTIFVCDGDVHVPCYGLRSRSRSEVGEAGVRLKPKILPNFKITVHVEPMQIAYWNNVRQSWSYLFTMAMLVASPTLSHSSNEFYKRFVRHLYSLGSRQGWAVLDFDREPTCDVM